MTDGPESPARWAPDPHDPSQIRYWDGQRWTEHTATAPTPATLAATDAPGFMDRRLGPVPIWALVVAVVAVVVAAVTFSQPKDDGPSDSGQSALRYTWTDSICTRDDYSGVITNTDTRTFTGKLWATGADETGSRERDQETVIDLAPGESETIEFVWVLDGDRATCSLDAVEWYP